MKKTGLFIQRKFIWAAAEIGIIFLLFFLCNQVIYGEEVIELNSGASADGEYISVDESFTALDGNEYQMTMTGLKEENADVFFQCVSENYDFETPLKVVDKSFCDAEKWSADFTLEYWNQYDDAQCWAASTSNILWISGWAQKMVNPVSHQPFSSEDEVFEYISSKFTDKGGDIPVGIDWFFTGEVFPMENAVHAGVVKPSLEEDGLFKEINSTSLQHVYDLVEDPSHIEQILSVSKQSDSPAVVGGSIGYLLDGQLLKSSHAITIAGLITDPYTDILHEKYKGIILINSDNDGHISQTEAAEDPPFGPDDIFDPEKTAQRRAYRANVKHNRPNSYTIYPLAYKLDPNGTGYWAIENYEGTESWALYKITVLELPDENVIQKAREIEGTKNIFTNVDLTLELLFTTDQDEVPADPYRESAKNVRKDVFVSGDPIRLMYYMGNRSNTMFEGEITMEWTIIRNADGVMISQGTMKRPFEIYHGIKMGDVLELNPDLEKWCSGKYTLTLYFNRDRAIAEAYYINNLEKSVQFTIIGNESPDQCVDKRDTNVAILPVSTPSSIQTGIHGNISLWISLLGASMSAVYVLLRKT